MAVPRAPCVEDVNVTVPVGTAVLEDEPEATSAVNTTVPPVATVLEDEPIVVTLATVPEAAPTVTGTGVGLVAAAYVVSPA